MSKPPPIGIRCYPVPLDDGTVAVLSRPGSRKHGQGGYFGRTGFRVTPGNESAPDILVAERPSDEAAIQQGTNAGGFTPFPWVPSLTVTFSTWAGGSSFPDFDIRTEWSIEAEPPFYPDSSLAPTYGVGAMYHIKIELGSTTSRDDNQYAGASGTDDTAGPFTAPVVCTATLTHGTTVLDTVSFTFT